VTCHAGSTTLRLQRFAPGTASWTEEQTRQNFEAAKAMVVPGRVQHGVTSAPDGTRLYFSNEELHTLDAVDASTFAVIARVPLSGRPNNVSISKDTAWR